ncbi:hypothetical protein [Microbulbifer sp. THAF38]|uniref:hypothetical protein n=1 Tax=Microbulbifer sp. THAF38 TaxID=2587856 RepID=UPI001268BE86|nr:hypothetical protein [Microbulbifer sp. THAF38]
MRRIIEAAEIQTCCDSEHRQASEHSVEEVAGVKIFEALGALRFLSGGGLNLSALDNLNIKTASDINISVGRDVKEQIGNIRESVAKVRQTIKVKDGGKVWLGSESLNVLKVLEDLIGVVSALAGTLATHTHPGNGQKRFKIRQSMAIRAVRIVCSLNLNQLRPKFLYKRKMIMEHNINRYAVFAERIHLMNGGAKSYRGSAPTEEAAMELAEEIAKSKKAEFYSWLQILDIVTGTYTEYSIKWGGVLEERGCPDLKGQCYLLP